LGARFLDSRRETNKRQSHGHSQLAWTIRENDVKLELHILQNFAPANLNRDDTNAPKSCDFGGYRRARISSQCLKRSIRETFKSGELPVNLPLAERTKRLSDALCERFVKEGKPDGDARMMANAAIGGLGFGLAKEDGKKEEEKEHKTEYLLFLSKAEIAELAAVCLTHWDTLTLLAHEESSEDPKDKRGKTGKDRKKDAEKALKGPIGSALMNVLRGGYSADLALFGRMIADKPEFKVDAACQVAHAISTHRVITDFDFYTAVDDRKPDDSSGADMMGTVEFNSACFYRYANIDIRQLLRNLQNDVDMARETIKAFLIASILAVPSGKQNSMAAQNPPSLVMTVVRERGLWSLANAFAKPVALGNNGDVVERSVQALDRYWGNLVSTFGTVLGEDWLRLICVADLDGVGLSHVQGPNAKDIKDLVDRTMAAIPTETAQ
jgi:CRISPR system Cascade subunit CasC